MRVKNFISFFLFTLLSGCYQSSNNGPDDQEVRDDIGELYLDFYPDSPNCGNGTLDPGEECDDGNAMNTDGCTALCRNARCGDGLLWFGIEQCDDGNILNNDGCSAMCQMETRPDARDDAESAVDSYPEIMPDDISGDDDFEPYVICGDGLCDGDESCDTCSADCGECPPVCENGICEDGENCILCLIDCGDCPLTDLPYANDFSGAVGHEWSRTAPTTAPNGERFLGEFGNEIVMLVLSGVPVDRDLFLSFDLYIIRSWDGNGDPDFFGLGYDTLRIMYTTFSNNPTEQSYPDEYRANHPDHTGALSIDTLGYGTEAWGDSIYRIERTVHTTGSSLIITFEASNLQVLSDESWGIDNVNVTE